MKKLLYALCALTIFSFAFVCAEEADAMQDHFLPSLDDEDESGLLDALQDSTDIIAQENEKIAQEEAKKQREQAARKERIAQAKQREREAKRQNKTLLGSVAVGANAPFTLNTNPKSKDGYDTPIPLGVSVYYIGNLSIFTFKTNLNWDFIKAKNDDSVRFNWIGSIGLTPIHNEYCFIGFYASMGLIDKIEKYEYTSFGGSANLLLNLSGNFGMFANLDATYRSKAEYKGDEEVAPYVAHYLNTWRVCPSIGFFYTFMKG